MKQLAFALAFVATLPLYAIQGTVYTTNGDSKTGDIKWQQRSKKYIVSYKKGKTSVDAEYPLADVDRIDVNKPANYDKLVEFVQKGQGGSAIAGLQKIVTDYQMLNWDKPAGRYLAFAYISAGQTQKAYDTCKAIVDEDKTAAYKGDLAPAYWQTLLKTGKKQALDTALKNAATKGDRAAACAAAAMQGDIVLADGENAANLKKALTEGYLKAFLMYTDADCTAERANAAMKAAECFDKLGQAARAEKIRAQAKAL